jgi:hypothetical protein
MVKMMSISCLLTIRALLMSNGEGVGDGGSLRRFPVTLGQSSLYISRYIWVSMV